MLSPHLCQRRLATMMSFLVFIYFWIILRPFGPQLSSPLPARCGVRLCPCAGRQNQSRAVGCTEAGPEPARGLCCRLSSGRWGLRLPAPLSQSGGPAGGAASKRLRRCREEASGWRCSSGRPLSDKGPATPGRAGGGRARVTAGQVKAPGKG